MSSIDTPSAEDSSSRNGEVAIPSSLAGLQTDESRQLFDTIHELRNCGLEDDLSLPQLLVCGDQSAGKSSVLEALTEIPFPRDENLCTRFATEITLRYAAADSLTVKVLPGSDRTPAEREKIKTFCITITDLSELGTVIDSAMEVMGISSDTSKENSQAFSTDILSVTSEGPSQPQLTLVDVPGLIGTATKGVTNSDLELVAGITERYISQPRTICVAVISAASDYATQSILKKVRDVDPKGERTLGIITKPDRIEGDGSKKAFVDLARNRDIVFKRGWHVLKNRGPGDSSSSHHERKGDEAKWFCEDPIFKVLPSNMVGIDSLRDRLRVLIFEHIKRELPQLRRELEVMLKETTRNLKAMGTRRSTAAECKEYLSSFSNEFQAICKAAVDGHYEGKYFTKYASSRHSKKLFDITVPSTYCRVRAVVQSLNTEFSKNMHESGHKYEIDWEDDSDSEEDNNDVPPPPDAEESEESEEGDSSSDEDELPYSTDGHEPIPMTNKQAIKWVHHLLVRTRGKELVGSFNPLLIGELFWEQSANWGGIAAEHSQQISDICSMFLGTLLDDKCPQDVRSRIWESIADKLRVRKEEADVELEKLLDDLRNYPINYNHYYTDTVTKRRQDRQERNLEERVDSMEISGSNALGVMKDKFRSLITSFSETNEVDMEQVSCEEALDSLFAIYKVQQKTFVANVTTQVIERHIVRGLETIFSPLVVNRLSDADALRIAAEPDDALAERARLEDKIRKLKDGHDAFRSAMGITLR